MSRCHSFPPPGYQIRYEAILDLLKEIKKDVVKERKKRKTMEKKLKKMERKEASRSKTRPHKKQRRDEDPKSILKIDDHSTVIMELEVKTSSQISYLDQHKEDASNSSSCKRFEVNGVQEKPCSSSPQESNDFSHLCSIELHPDAIQVSNLDQHKENTSNSNSCKGFEVNGVQDKLCSSTPQESNESSHLCSIGLHSDAKQISYLDQNKEDTSNSCKRFEVNSVQDKLCSSSPQESNESSHFCSIGLHPDATQISYFDQHKENTSNSNSCKEFEVNAVQDKSCSSTPQESNESSHLCTMDLHPDATQISYLDQHKENTSNSNSCKGFEVNGVEDKLCSSSPEETNESSHLCSTGLHPDAIQVSYFDQDKEDTSNSCKRFGVEDKLCSSSPQENNESSHLCSLSLHPDATQFMDLIENWVLDKTQRKLSDFEDVEWLFKKPNCEKFSANKDEISNLRTSYGKCSSLWPTACYLPEAEVHALPFTVPF